MAPVTLVAAALAASAAIPLGVLVHLVRAWRPVSARRVSDDYGEGERLLERGMPGHATLAPDLLDEREVTVRAEYEVGGELRRADVGVWVHRGRRPDSQFVIWYDPDHPERVTAKGVGFWLACTAAPLAAAGLLLHIAGTMHPAS